MYISVYKVDYNIRPSGFQWPLRAGGGPLCIRMPPQSHLKTEYVPKDGFSGNSPEKRGARQEICVFYPLPPSLPPPHPPPLSVCVSLLSPYLLYMTFQNGVIPENFGERRAMLSPPGFCIITSCCSVWYP